MSSPETPRIPRTPRHLLLAAVMLLSLSPGFALAAPAGTVVGLSGAGMVESGGSRSAAKIGQPVQVGDTLDVPADGKLKLRMADGSVISVASGTRMTIAAYSVDAAGQRQDARVSLAQGLLRAVVAPVERPASFEVDTAVGTAAVRSTDWFVEATATAMQVGVLTGSVVMTSSATKRGVTVAAHWGSRLEGSASPPTAVASDQPGGLHPIPPPLVGPKAGLPPPGSAPQHRPGALGLDPVPPRLWSQAEFAAVIARTDVP